MYFGGGIMPAKKTKKKNQKCMPKCGCGGAFYGLGFIGALIYYLVHATGFWVGVLGVLKAIVWPVFVVYGLMGFLGL